MHADLAAGDAVPDLTHVDAEGNAHMVDVTAKRITHRVAVAQGWITVNHAAFTAIAERTAKKGDVLTVAQIAGIQGAKRTSDLIPLCHPLSLSGVDVSLSLNADERRVWVTATARTSGQTGVEMEALTAVSTALLTVYDMVKAVDKTMEIGGIRLMEKRGGRSGTWVREAE